MRGQFENHFCDVLNRTLPRVTISDFSALNIDCVEEEVEEFAPANDLAGVEVTLEDVALFKKGQLFAGGKVPRAKTKPKSPPSGLSSSTSATRYDKGCP